jgi:hypothetical protein
MSERTYLDGCFDGAERMLRMLEEKTRDIKGNERFRDALKDHWGAVKTGRRVLNELREVRAASNPGWPSMVA